MTWANADPGLCLHMASLGSNELKIFHPDIKAFSSHFIKKCSTAFLMLSAKKTPQHDIVLFEQNPPLKEPIMRKTFPCHSVIISYLIEMHIFVGVWNIMGLDYWLTPIRQAITETNICLLPFMHHSASRLQTLGKCKCFIWKRFLQVFLYQGPLTNMV